MRALLILSIFMIQNGYAQSMRAPVMRLNELNSSETLAPVIRCEEEGRTPGTNLQQCLVDLCGEADQKNTVFLTNENLDQFTDRTILENFPNLTSDINSTGQYFQEVNDLVMEEFQRRLDNKNSDIHSLGKDANSAQMYAQMIFENLLMAEVDHSKPLNERLSVQTLPHFQGEEFDKALKDFAQKHRQAVSNGLWYERVFQGIYTPEESYEEIMRRLPEVRRSYEDEYGQNFLPYDVAQTFDYLEDRLRQTQDSFYPEDAQRATAILVDLEFSLRMQKGEVIPQPPLTCTSGECLAYAQNELKNINLPELINSFTEKNQNLDTSEAINNCETFILSQSFGQRENVERFRENVPRVVENYKNKVLSRFSEETKTYLTNQLDNEVNFVFPNYAQRQQDIESTLFDAFSRAENGLPPLDSLHQIPTPALIRWVTLTKRPDTGEFDPFYPLDNLCAPGPYPTANDSFLPVSAFDQANIWVTPGQDSAKSNIHISPFSCEHPHHGEDVLSHELSHFVSYLFAEGEVSSTSKNDFLKLRECSIKMYEDSVYSSGEYQFLFNHEADLRTTEEDTADFLAFLAYPELEDKPFSCAMLQIDPEGGYINMDYSTVSGPHSLPYFRVLNEAIQKGYPLSQSCERFLVQAEPEFKRVKCEP